MAAPRAYLDWNATTPVHPAAKAAVLVALDCLGNPSSIHTEGRAARAILETARADLAALVGGEAENVVFTSGATEAANALFRAGLSGCCGKDIACAMRPMVSAVEHAAVIAAAGVGASFVQVDANGLVDTAALTAMLAEGGPAMVAIQLANNETGVVQDIPALAGIVHAAGGALIVDAVQAPGKLPLDIKALGADAIFLSAHKFGGPKGVGAIVFPDSRTRLAEAFIGGGGQERGQRGGTENLTGIAGMGAAARVAREMDEAVQRMIQLRGEFENHLNRLAPDVAILSQRVSRLVNTTCFAVPGLAAERALIAFDLDGVAVSSGSACSSGKVKASHVLTAMGMPDGVKAGAIRVSIGPTTVFDDLERCLNSLARQIQRRAKTKAA
ncbi:MAG: cysteine desulfurase [Rhizobiales bacterium PAR1]|nr:MAG: cysteine desulfurase [Rhizobiales bacterium PAR1]